jgi:FRG domain
MILEYSFENWHQFKSDFADKLGVSLPLIERFVFRGQADSRWGIESSFDRMCPARVTDRDKYYRQMLTFFAYQLRQYGEDLDPLSRQDRGAIAQHYGMPTRLIDWSKSPYVAAFMAFYSALTEKRVVAGERIAIWALDLDRFAALTDDSETAFRTVKTRQLQNDRVWRQAGLFVEARSNQRKFDDYLTDLAVDGHSGLIKFSIPSLEAVIALNDLILMGLTPATIYPDRDGAAKYVLLRMAMEERC